MALKYSESGVDINAADAWVAGLGANLRKPEQLKSGIGSYAAVYGQNESEWLALSCDGIGTKLLWALDGLGNIENLGQDLVAMNANDLLCVGATPKLFLDYLAIGSKDMLKETGVLAKFISGIEKSCAEVGMWLVGGETAQMPDLYQAGHFDCAGFALGFLKPEEFLSVESLRPGQEVWGLSSSGPHSNGFSLLRKLFDSKKDASFIEEHLMLPTRLYVNDFLKIRGKLGSHLQGAFHITGSGFWNFLRAQPEGRKIGFDFKNANFLNPLWFEEVRKRSKLKEEDLWSTFNGGIGFAVVLSNADQEQKEFIKSLGFAKLGALIEESVIRMPFGDFVDR